MERSGLLTLPCCAGLRKIFESETTRDQGTKVNLLTGQKPTKISVVSEIIVAAEGNSVDNYQNFENG